MPKEDRGKNTKTLRHCRLKQFRDNGAKIQSSTLCYQVFSNENNNFLSILFPFL